MSLIVKFHMADEHVLDCQTFSFPFEFLIVKLHRLELVEYLMPSQGERWTQSSLFGLVIYCS